MEVCKSVLSRVKTANINLFNFLLHSSVGLQRVKMASRARKSVLSQDQIRELLFTESGNESDGKDDNYCDKFMVSEKKYSSTLDKDGSLDADTLVLRKLIYHIMKIYTLSLIEGMQSIFLFHI